MFFMFSYKLKVKLFLNISNLTLIVFWKNSPEIWTFNRFLFQEQINLNLKIKFWKIFYEINYKCMFTRNFSQHQQKHPAMMFLKIRLILFICNIEMIVCFIFRMFWWLTWILLRIKLRCFVCFRLHRRRFNQPLLQHVHCS